MSIEGESAQSSAHTLVAACRYVDLHRSGVGHRKVKPGSQSIAYDFVRMNPGAVEGRHLEELGIDLEPEHRAGNQSGGVGPIDHLVGNQEQDHRQRLDLQQGRRRLEHDPRLPFSGFLLPSCEPSTPFGFP